MYEWTPEEIKKKAHEYVDSGVLWHAHFFTPECQLNTTRRYLTLLECPAEDFLAAYFQDDADKTLIGYLTPMLHGANIKDDHGSTDNKDFEKLPDDAQRILKRAKEMNTKGIAWHHHVLFSDCKFNKNQPNWTLVIEDPEAGTTLNSISDHEPKEVLKFLEPLFYAS